MTLNGVSLAVQMEVLADVVAGKDALGDGSWKGRIKGDRINGDYFTYCTYNWDIYKGLFSPTDP